MRLGPGGFALSQKTTISFATRRNLIVKVLIIGATGTIGAAVADALEAGGHDVLCASRNAELSVNIAQPSSIAALYRRVGKLDAVICCAGSAAFKPLPALEDADLEMSLRDKLMGQVNLVRLGLHALNDGGVFVLTSGIFSRNPMPGVSAIAMTNGAIESFTRAAALDLPRGLRINAVSPPLITETARKMGFPTQGTLSAAENAEAYVSLVQGGDTGCVIFSGD